MKDATGELSMTAIAVVAIAAIGVVFTTLVWPQIRANIMRSTYCSQATNCKCDAGGDSDDMCSCDYCVDEACNTQSTIQCPRSGKGSTDSGKKAS